MRSRWILVSMVGFFVLISCASAPHTSYGEGRSITGTRWELLEMPRAGTEVAPATERPYLLLDSHSDQFSGSTGCNIVSGRYAIGADHAIEFSELSMTKRACMESIGIEIEFLSALKNAHQYGMDDSRLTLEDASGTTLARLVAAAD